MRKALAAAGLVTFGILAYAGADNDLERTEPDLGICQQALRQLSKGERAGFDVLFEATKREEKDVARLAKQADSQIDGIRDWVDAVGELHGIDLVHIEEVGHVMRRYFYVCKYERGWMRWRFTFYRPASEWRFESYDLDGTENALFSECGHSLEVPDLSVAARTLDRP